MPRRPTPEELLAGYRLHARKRYRERLGKKLTDAGYAVLCRRVGDPDTGRFLWDAGGGRAMFAVLFRGDELYVVVDLELEVVVTVLPQPETVNPEKARERWHWRRHNLA